MISLVQMRFPVSAMSAELRFVAAELSGLATAVIEPEMIPERHRHFTRSSEFHHWHCKDSHCRREEG